MGCPDHADAGLPFPARVIVVLDLDATGQAQLLRDQFHLILCEGAKQIRRQLIRANDAKLGIGKMILITTIPHAPDYFLSISQCEIMLKIQIKRLRIRYVKRIATIGILIINL